MKVEVTAGAVGAVVVIGAAVYAAFKVYGAGRAIASSAEIALYKFKEGTREIAEKSMEVVRVDRPPLNADLGQYSQRIETDLPQRGTGWQALWWDLTHIFNPDAVGVLPK